MNRAAYESLLASLRRQIVDNERDIQRGCERLVELMTERQTLQDGIKGLTEEIERSEKERIQ